MGGGGFRERERGDTYVFWCIYGVHFYVLECLLVGMEMRTRVDV